MTEDAATPKPDEAADSPAAPPPQPKPVARKDDEIVQGEVVEDEKLLRLEARLIRVLRKEVQDPYAGLPADDVLDRLDRRFPEQRFAERMLRRVELEQAARHERELRQDSTQQYIAETDRHDGEGERDLDRRAGARAERIVLVVIAVGLLLVFAGYPEIGGIVLGTTLVGVAAAFIANQVTSR